MGDVISSNNDEAYPVAVWFVDRPSEYLSFIGKMLQVAAMGYSFGLGAATLDKPNATCAAPGLWVQYSDNEFVRAGSGARE